MGLEQEGGLVTGFLAGLLGKLTQLLHRLLLGVLEARPLGVSVGHGGPGYGALCPLIEVQRTQSHSIGDTFSLYRNHLNLPVD